MTTPVGDNDPEGEDLLPLSALNDLLYCERRCWLHRVAGIDDDNAYTLLGAFDHERADEASVERRPGVRIERALPLVSRALGIIGRADVVEFRADSSRNAVGATEGGLGEAAPQTALADKPPVAPGDVGRDARPPTGEIPYPVDYKHGPKRKWDNDDVQLCAQAMCLEEMLSVAVPAGAIFHATSKRRREVVFTEVLREQVRRAAAELHRLMRTNRPPPAGLRPQCEGCSIHRHCLPEAGEAAERIRRHLGELFEC
jgi:CRISPR-associated exonuclease Cas4